MTTTNTEKMSSAEEEKQESSPFTDDSLSTVSDEQAIAPAEPFQSPKNFTELQKILEETPNPEVQIRMLLVFMEQMLSQKGGPSFKAFWDAKKICVDSFKKSLSVSARGELWSRYVEISKEARRLKDLLDEQSQFAAEQIEKAIEALEEELKSSEGKEEKVAVFQKEDFPIILEASFEIYQRRQKQLNLLNAFAGQITELRKELIKTDMRIRRKNTFFQRLSSLGDQVFPQRKELIQQTSEMFEKDIEQFKDQCLSESDRIPYVFQLREDIKALQSFAKILTLNTHAFNRTRLLLSQCWDQLNVWDKELKKKKAEKRQIFRENYDLFKQQLEQLQQAVQQHALSFEQAWTQLESFGREMRQVELDREDVKVLREMLQEIRAPLQEQLKEREELQKKEREAEKLERQEKLNAFENRLDDLLQNGNQKEYSVLLQEHAALAAAIEELSKVEKSTFSRKLRPIQDLLIEKREQEFLSDEDRQNLEKCRLILEERKKRRQEIKQQVEQLRKAAGSTGLDFDQAMNRQAQLQEEKQRLDKLDASIVELEKQIRDIHSC